MWKSCQEKTGVLDTKCCGEVVVSVYVSWYVCESYVSRFGPSFSFYPTILIFFAVPSCEFAKRRGGGSPPARFGFGFSLDLPFGFLFHKTATPFAQFCIVEHARATTIDFHPRL